MKVHLQSLNLGVLGGLKGTREARVRAVCVEWIPHLCCVRSLSAACRLSGDSLLIDCGFQVHYAGLMRSSKHFCLKKRMKPAYAG
jgi:hypothetical protein